MHAFDRATLALPAIVLSLFALSGCATAAPRSPDPRDPFEQINRGTFAFNQSLDKAVVRPVLRGYRKVTPRVVRTGIANFFSNAQYPIVIFNDLLQGKLAPAANDTGRFLLNTTLGVGGLLDPATDAGLDRNNEDFGQTLGRWGVPPGPYVMLPFIGPYTLRDGIAGIADDLAEPRAYLRSDLRWGLWAGGQLNRRAGLTEAEAILDRSGDPYAFVRSAYLQRRQYLVTDGAVSDEAPVDEDPALEDPEMEDPQLMEDASGDTPTAPQ
jgi:phospholipid-binding lipoprotein MlaA